MGGGHRASCPQKKRGSRVEPAVSNSLMRILIIVTVVKMAYTTNSTLNSHALASRGLAVGAGGGRRFSAHSTPPPTRSSYRTPPPPYMTPPPEMLRRNLLGLFSLCGTPQVTPRGSRIPKGGPYKEVGSIPCGKIDGNEFNGKLWKICGSVAFNI